ncbi:MAG: hypothetical protein GXO07_04345 [Crenarchaeota archaeon]|nr:hypothetical protein [Thermoproteota archaeon]
MKKLALPGKEIASVSKGVAVGSLYEGGGFATFFDEDLSVYEELRFADSVDFVSCEENLCALYSGGHVHVVSRGSVLKRFESRSPINWILLTNGKIIVTHDEGVTAYNLDGSRAWEWNVVPARGVAENKGYLYVGTSFGVVVLHSNDATLAMEVELGTGNWRVTSSCSSAVLVVDDEEAKAYVLLTVKELGDPEVVGVIPNVIGTPWISPDCLYVAVPRCGVSVYDSKGHEIFSDSLESSDECVGIWAYWDEELLVGVADEGLWTSYVLLYEYPFKRSN